MERMFHFGLVILIEIGKTSWRGGELRRKKHWVMGRWVEIQLLRDLWTLLTPLISRLFGGVRKNRLGSWWDVGQGKATTCSKQKGVLWLMRYNKCWFEWNKYSIETPWETLTSTLESLTCFFQWSCCKKHGWKSIGWLVCTQDDNHSSNS